MLLFAAIATAAYFYMPAKYRPLKAEEAVKTAVDFVNTNLLAANVAKATYKDIKEEDGLYKFTLTIEGQDYDSYITKSGQLFFPQVINIKQEIEKSQLTKSDKPDVKLFVMSYCPYGLQAEKMYLPVYNLLKDKTNMGIYFVNYAMHGKKELDENLRQYCIQKDQNDKYVAYLECFTSSTAGKDGSVDPATCLAKANIDKTKLNECIKATDEEYKVTANYNNKDTWLSGSYPTFEVNNELNEQYNVQGSPTIIINDKDASSQLSSRTPEAFKELVCSAFNEKPAECDTTLSNDAPAAGFGTATDNANTANSGGCGN